MSNDIVINEKRIGKNMEGTDCDLISGTVPEFA
jgi:hypothetical protein